MHSNSPDSCAHGRRNFLLASAALGTSLLLHGAARAAQIKRMDGQVTVNGKKAKASTRIKPGDLIVTGAEAKLVFALGQDAFLLRGGSKLKLEASKAGKDTIVSGLRLLTGALLAVLGKGTRRIETTTAIAGIRGTGVYIEASAEQTYFCTCYGEVELRSRAGNERKLVISGYHTPTMIYAQLTDGKMMSGAAFKDHTDEELIMLSRTLGQKSPIEERDERLKGTGDGQAQDTAKPTAQPPQSAAPEQPSPSAKVTQATPETEKPPAKQSPVKQRAKKPPSTEPAPATQTKQTSSAQAGAKKAPAAQAAPPQGPVPQSTAPQAPANATPAPETTTALPPAPEPEVPRELPPATLEERRPPPRPTQ